MSDKIRYTDGTNKTVDVLVANDKILVITYRADEDREEIIYFDDKKLATDFAERWIK
jgi:hypothetical protein